MEASISQADVDDDSRFLVKEYFKAASAPWLGALAVHQADPSDEIKSLAYYEAKTEALPKVDHALDVYLDAELNEPG